MKLKKVYFKTIMVNYTINNNGLKIIYMKIENGLNKK